MKMDRYIQLKTEQHATYCDRGKLVRKLFIQPGPSFYSLASSYFSNTKRDIFADLSIAINNNFPYDIITSNINLIVIAIPVAEYSSIIKQLVYFLYQQFKVYLQYRIPTLTDIICQQNKNFFLQAMMYYSIKHGPSTIEHFPHIMQ